MGYAGELIISDLYQRKKKKIFVNCALDSSISIQEII